MTVCNTIGADKWNQLITKAEDYFRLIRYLTKAQREKIASALIQIDSRFITLMNDERFVKIYKDLEYKPSEVTEGIFNQTSYFLRVNNKALNALTKVTSVKKTNYTPRKLVIHFIIWFHLRLVKDYFQI